MNRSTQSGFTLIELVVVIVILGIVAAIALPRLISMQGESRSAVVDSLHKSLHSSANMVYEKVASAGELADNSYNVDIGGGVTVNARYGYPDTNSDTNIGNLFEDLSDRVTISGNGGGRNVWVDGLTDCGVVYHRAENAGERPTIEARKTGCD